MEEITKPRRHMVLSLFMITGGYHYDSWTLPGSRVEELGYPELIVDMARRAEAAKLDALFFGDISSAGKVPGADPTVSGHYEPITSLAVVSQHTSRIGLIGTASTTFCDPYNVARQFAGLDTLSHGRAGWNIVTSASGNENFGLDSMPPPEERYRRATEFTAVVTALWDSWSDEAVISDRARGIWADPAKIRAIDHKGEYFSVQGPINMRRPPQGRPIMVQAGSSGPGIELGSSYADAIYTAQPDRGESIDFYRFYKEKVRSKGRNPDHVKILPGLVPILGRTEKEAQELVAYLGAHVRMDTGRYILGQRLKMRLGELDLDRPSPAEWFLGPEQESNSRYQIFRHLAVDKGYTLRELILEHARGHGHQWVSGTPAAVADRMIDWFENGACDGFSLNSAFVPGGLDLICDLLVPELQERGYFRTEYEGTTLRDHLSLPRPGAWDTAR